MGWGYFPNLLDPNVICQTPCTHDSCNTWKHLDKTCSICGKEVKTGQRFYFQGEKRVAHAVCVIEKEEGR